MARHHPPALAARHLCAHAAAARHAAFRERLCAPRRAHPVVARAARLLRPRTFHLDAPRRHPPALERHAGGQGHPDRGRRAAGAPPRRGRDHRLEPWRPATGRRHRAAARPARDRSRRARSAGDARQRRTPRHRRDQGARARRALRLCRTAVRLCGDGRVHPGVAHAIDLLQAEISRDMAMLGLPRLADIGPACIRPAASLPHMPPHPETYR